MMHLERVCEKLFLDRLYVTSYAVILRYVCITIFHGKHPMQTDSRAVFVALKLIGCRKRNDQYSDFASQVKTFSQKRDQHPHDEEMPLHHRDHEKAIWRNHRERNHSGEGRNPIVYLHHNLG